MSRTVAAEYDALPYPNRAIEQTHCDRLRTLARLFGVKSAPTEKCRVLELGCGGGLNLVSMALGLPDSEFVGIDASPRQVAMGEELANAVGVRNVELAARSILDVGPHDGRFDFIVCHGVYSWVGADVREKIFAIFKENLAPGGVAYLSYNALPGFYSRAKFRDFMRYHAMSVAEPARKVDQGLAALKWLVDALGERTPYAQEAKMELEVLRHSPVSYVFSEIFSEHNQPFYFSDIEARARAAGLRYLAESDPMLMLQEFAPPSAVDLLARLGDPVRVGQYLDFLGNRPFRATLFCHAEERVSATMDAACVGEGFVSGACSIEGDAMDRSNAKVTLVTARGGRAEVAQPLLKYALGVLSARVPEPMTLDALVEATRDAGLEQDAARFRTELAGALLKLSLFGFVKLRGFAPKVTATPGQRPLARSLARREALEEATATNVWHETVAIDPLQRKLLPLLDGTRDAAALASTAAAASGDDVDAALVELARRGLLVTQ